MKPRRIATTSVGWMKIDVYKDKDLIERDRCRGTWERDLQKITLDAGISGSLLNDTVVHELIHAASDLYDLRISEQKTVVLAAALTQGLNNLKKLSRRSKKRGV